MGRMASREGEETTVRLRAPGPASLFNDLDPTPIPGRELDPAIAEYISDRWFDGRGRHAGEIRLAVHFDERPSPVVGAEVEEALRRAFERQGERADQSFSSLMIQGRRSLIISTSFVVLSIVVLVAIWGDPTEAPPLAGGTASIASWVVLWRPIEIFFYDWWPIAAERRMWRRLRDAPIDLSSP